MLWPIDNSWTLFLDRDGVVNVRILNEYVKTKEEFVLLPGVSQSIAKANQVFGRVVVVTNQQGIAKNLMTERNLLDIHTYCDELLLKDNARIDAYYFAPNKASDEDKLRKPKTGMADLAKQDFPEIDFSKSVMVGDSFSDIEFGTKLGMKTIFIESYEQVSEMADISVKSLKEAIDKILE